jgi:hypothetical protein
MNTGPIMIFYIADIFHFQFSGAPRELASQHQMWTSQHQMIFSNFRPGISTSKKNL